MTSTIAPSNSITTITPLSSGSVLLSGWGAVFREVDRQGDRWTPEAFEGHADRFMQGDRPLRFHHRKDLPTIGTVDDLHISSDGYGVRAHATLDYCEPTHPMRPVFEGVLRKVINSYSFGAFFTRQPLPDGTKNIIGAELTELSLTASPVGYSTWVRPVATGADPLGDPEARLWLAQVRQELGL
jgi:hypothetical protein